MPGARSLPTLAAIKALSHPEQFPRVVLGATPAAGAEIALTVPGDTIWRVRSIHFHLVTSAAAANRQLSIFADDGSTEFFRTGLTANIPASTNAQVCAFAGAGAGLNLGVFWTTSLPSPELLLLPGFRLRTLTTNLQAGDQFTAIAVYVTDVAASPADVDLARELAQMAGRLPYATAEEEGGF